MVKGKCASVAAACRRRLPPLPSHPSRPFHSAAVVAALQPDTVSREMGQLAVWSVTSAKPGNGVELLRDGREDTYWQSDGAQPHLVNVQFQKKVGAGRSQACTAARGTRHAAALCGQVGVGVQAPRMAARLGPLHTRDSCRPLPFPLSTSATACVTPATMLQVYLSEVAIYADYKLDESYTPTKACQVGDVPPPSRLLLAAAANAR